MPNFGKSTQEQGIVAAKNIVAAEIVSAVLPRQCSEIALEQEADQSNPQYDTIESYPLSLIIVITLV